MGHDSVVSTVTSFKEETHAGNEAEHGRLVVAVAGTDGNQEGTSNKGE